MVTRRLEDTLWLSLSVESRLTRSSWKIVIRYYKSGLYTYIQTHLRKIVWEEKEKWNEMQNESNFIFLGSLLFATNTIYEYYKGE